MRRRAVPAAREPFEHVAEVAHDHARGRFDVDPCAIDGAHLKPTELVLSKQCEQAVVAVFADAPVLVVVGIARGIVEDAEQHRGVSGELAFEPVGWQSESERDAAHHRISHRPQRVEPPEHRGAQIV